MSSNTLVLSDPCRGCSLCHKACAGTGVILLSLSDVILVKDASLPSSHSPPSSPFSATCAQRGQSVVCSVCSRSILTKQSHSTEHYHTKKFRDCGGKMEADLPPKKKLSENAAKELCEETRGIINMKASDIRGNPKIDIEKSDSGHHFYRCYLVRRDKVDCSEFYKADLRGKPKQYKETTEMKRFPIALLKARFAQAGPEGRVTSLSDSDGKEQPLGGRARKILFQALAMNVL